MNAKKIAVIGAGNGGYAVAANLTLAGHEVNLYEIPQFKENLDPVFEEGGIHLSGVEREGFARIHKVTTDLAEAIGGVNVILVTTQEGSQETIARLCVPYLEDEQSIVLFAGRCGSLIFAKILKEEGMHRHVRIAETVTLPYGCRRVIGQAKVDIKSIMMLTIAALPAKDTERVLEDMKDLYPDTLSIGKNVLEVALSDGNIYFHVPIAILNYRSIEASGGKFYPFKDGVSPSVMRVTEAVEREGCAILRALGLSDRLPVLQYVKSGPMTNPTPSMLNIVYQDRFITEDAPIGMVLLASLGDWIGIPTPVTKAFITLASEIKGVDYFKEGRTVERLGISGMSIGELNEFLASGNLDAKRG